MAKPTAIDISLKRFSGAQLKALTETVDRLRQLLPATSEGKAWGMPTFFADGIALIGLEGFKKHNSVFPMSGRIPRLLEVQLAGYAVSKGTIQFPLDKPMPKPILKAIVKARIEELNASFPKASGEYRQFYDNGALQSSGRMSGKVMTGAWRWYRRDGSLMRTGSFTKGEQTGEWVTYDAAGRVVKRTQMGAKPAAKKPAVKKAPVKKAAKKSAVKKSAVKKPAVKKLARKSAK